MELKQATCVSTHDLSALLQKFDDLNAALEHLKSIDIELEFPPVKRSFTVMFNSAIGMSVDCTLTHSNNGILRFITSCEGRGRCYDVTTLYTGDIVSLINQLTDIVKSGDDRIEHLKL